MVRTLCSWQRDPSTNLVSNDNAKYTKSGGGVIMLLPGKWGGRISQIME